MLQAACAACLLQRDSPGNLNCTNLDQCNFSILKPGPEWTTGTDFGEPEPTETLGAGIFGHF